MSSQTRYDLSKETGRGKLHMEKFCSEFGIVMPKCIRLSNLSILRKLSDLGCTNFQVVHLIRDPRAVMRSRMVTFHQLLTSDNKRYKVGEFTDEMLFNASRGMCAINLHNFQVSEEDWISPIFKKCLTKLQNFVIKTLNKNCLTKIAKVL